MRMMLRDLSYLLAVVAGAGLVSVGQTQAPQAQHVLVLTIDGVIGPATADSVHCGLERARAVSAGTYILYVSHIAAMAPATNLGAATPVAIGMPGGSLGKPGSSDLPAPIDAMRAKAVEDAAAYINSCAQLRGRNADFAEQAVRAARSLSSTAAMAGGVVDVVAVDVPGLLHKIDGRNVELFDAAAATSAARKRAPIASAVKM